MIDYKDFWLRIERRGDAFWISSRSSDAGDSSEELELPPDFEKYNLANLLGAERASSRGEGQRDVVFKGETAPQPDLVGEELYRTLFTGQIRDAFNRNWGSGKEGGVRIRLQTDLNDPQLARLASLPWELLYNEGTRMALGRSKFTPIVRYLDVPLSYETFPLDGALRVLIVLANPAGTHPLELAKEKDSIEETWAKLDGVEVTILEHATRHAMFDKLDTGKYHVLHYMGHGGFDEQTGEGVLFLEDEEGNAAPLSGKMLGETLYEMRSMRLVFLNACDTGKTSHEPGLDPYSGLASALVMAGVPAVVAMQVPIADSAALEFAEKFYTQLAHQEPVDAAVAVGRRAIHRANPASLEWATPVLFMRAKDGRLFDTESAVDLAEPASISPSTVSSALEESTLTQQPSPVAKSRSKAKGFNRKWLMWSGVAAGLVLILYLLVSLFSEKAAPSPEVAALLRDNGYENFDIPARDLAQVMVREQDEQDQDGFALVGTPKIFSLPLDGMRTDYVEMRPGFEYKVYGHCGQDCQRLYLGLFETLEDEIGLDSAIAINPIMSLIPPPYEMNAQLEIVIDECADDDGCLASYSVYRRPVDPLAAQNPALGEQNQQQQFSERQTDLPLPPALDSCRDLTIFTNDLHQMALAIESGEFTDSEGVATVVADAETIAEQASDAQLSANVDLMSSGYADDNLLLFQNGLYAVATSLNDLYAVGCQ